MKTFVFMMMAALSGPAIAQSVQVPSGQEVQFLELIAEQVGETGLTYRFRFVAPAISRAAGTVKREQVAADMDRLCAAYAVPVLMEKGVAPDQVIISVSDRPVEFGVAAPEATQYFEAYRVQDNACIWEGF